jgi:hypothetical protein
MVKFVYNQMYHTLTKMQGSKKGCSISVSPHEIDDMIKDLEEIKKNLQKQGLM